MSTQSIISNEVLKEQVSLIISEQIGEFIANYVNEHELKLKEISLIERVVRVEEELKALRELEQKRHEFLVSEMNTRFEAMNIRFEALQKDMNTRFEALHKEMDTRFEAVNTRFDSLEKKVYLYAMAYCIRFCTNCNTDYDEVNNRGDKRRDQVVKGKRMNHRDTEKNSRVKRRRGKRGFNFLNYNYSSLLLNPSLCASVVNIFVVNNFFKSKVKKTLDKIYCKKLFYKPCIYPLQLLTK